MDATGSAGPTSLSSNRTTDRYRADNRLRSVKAWDEENAVRIGANADSVAIL